MASYNQGSYTITTYDNGRVRVVPTASNGLKSLTIGVESSLFTIVADDINNQTEPLIFKKLITEDREKWKNYHLGQPSDLLNFGLSKVVEEYSGEVVKTNADGVKYTELTGYKRWKSTGYNIFVDMVNLHKIGDNIGNSKLSWSSRLNSFITPTYLNHFFSTDAVSPLMFIHVDDRKSCCYLSPNGFVAFDRFDKYNTKKLDISILNTLLENFISTNGLKSFDGNPAVIVEAVATTTTKDVSFGVKTLYDKTVSTITIRFNNGRVATFDVLTKKFSLSSATRVVRLEPNGNTVKASGKYCIGDNGALAYKTPSKTVEATCTPLSSSGQHVQDYSSAINLASAFSRWSGSHETDVTTKSKILAKKFLVSEVSHLSAYQDDFVVVPVGYAPSYVSTITCKDYNVRKTTSFSNGKLTTSLSNFGQVADGDKVLPIRRADKLFCGLNVYAALEASQMNLETSKTIVYDFGENIDVDKNHLGFFVVAESFSTT